jgi:hypothetical protein
LNDTWEWNGTTWTQQAPTTSPTARQLALMAYDSARNVTVLFGGVTSAGYVNDTWEWNGTTWTQDTPNTSPSIRYAASMADDTATGTPLLYGGSTLSGGYLTDTWEFLY